MIKKNSNVVLTGDVLGGIVIHDDIDKTDLANIKLAQIEGQLVSRDDNLTADISAANKQVKDLTAQVNDAALEVAEKHFKAPAAKAIAALKSVFPKLQSKVEGVLETGNGSKKVVHSTLNISSVDDRGYGLTKTAERPVTSAMKTLLSQIDHLNSVIDTFKDEKLRVRTARSRMNMVERQIKGTISAARVASTEGGQELLDSLEEIKIVGVDFAGLLPAPSDK